MSVYPVRLVDTMMGGGESVQDWSAPALRLTLRTIIQARVEREVAAFNANRPDVYHGLVAPAECERVLNGYRVKRLRELDASEEVDRAFHAFEAKGFAVFVNGRQVETLDEEIDLEAAKAVEFVRLLPLMGG
jgi:hypothetical protein